MEECDNNPFQVASPQAQTDSEAKTQKNDEAGSVSYTQ